MANKGFDLGNYVEVDERIQRFYERYPDGRVTTVGLPQVVHLGGKEFIVAQAAAYRTADDPTPCVGTAAEPFPGTTSYTKDSEMMNAETSAWGRALVAAGILAKGEKVASRNEVRNRTVNIAVQGAGSAPLDEANSGVPAPAPTTPPPADPKAHAYLLTLGGSLSPEVNATTLNGLLQRHSVTTLVERLENKHREQHGAECAHVRQVTA